MRLRVKIVLLNLFAASASAALASTASPESPPSGLPEAASPLKFGSFTLYSENDKYLAGTDQAYTNGLKLSFLSRDLSSFTDPSVPAPVRGVSHALDRLVPSGQPYKLGFSLGQNLYTPVDTQTAVYQPDDRPYAAWLYAGIAFHVLYPEALSGRASRLDVYEINFGVVGPAALGEDTQRGFHDLIDADEVFGWDNQIHNEPGVNLIYERKYRYSTPDARTGWGADFIPHVGLSVGNVFTYANLGAEIRVGWHLPADFGSNLIRPSGDSNSDGVQRARFGLFFFTAVDGRAVARDITLDGNTFRDSPSIDKKPFVGDLYAGVGLAFTHWQIRYAQAYRTKEFARQNDQQSFGSISVSYLY